MPEIGIRGAKCHVNYDELLCQCREFKDSVERKIYYPCHPKRGILFRCGDCAIYINRRFYLPYHIVNLRSGREPVCITPHPPPPPEVKPRCAAKVVEPPVEKPKCGAKVEDPPVEKPKCGGSMKQVRASELPIYQDDTNITSSKMSCSRQSLPLEEPISKVRKEVGSCVDQYKDYGSKVSDVVKTGVEHTKATIDYLKDEGNVLPRAGAIALGGLTGYILGMRRGRIRRYFNTSVGALGVAAFLYPCEARQVAGGAYDLSKKAVLVSYNFIVGAKPDTCKQTPEQATPREGGFFGSCKIDKKPEEKSCPIREEESSFFGSCKKEKKPEEKSTTCGCGCRDVSFYEDDDWDIPRKRRRWTDNGAYISVDRRSVSDTNPRRKYSENHTKREPSSDVTADCYRERKEELMSDASLKRILISPDSASQRQLIAELDKSSSGESADQRKDVVIVGKIITLDKEDKKAADIPQQMPYSGKHEEVDDMEDWAYFSGNEENLLHYDKKTTEPFVWDPSEEVPTNVGFLPPMKQLLKENKKVEKTTDDNLCDTREFHGTAVCRRNFPLQEASHDSDSVCIEEENESKQKARSP